MTVMAWARPATMVPPKMWAHGGLIGTILTTSLYSVFGLVGVVVAALATVLGIGGAARVSAGRAHRTGTGLGGSTGGRRSGGLGRRSGSRVPGAGRTGGRGGGAIGRLGRAAGRRVRRTAGRRPTKSRTDRSSAGKPSRVSRMRDRLANRRRWNDHRPSGGNGGRGDTGPRKYKRSTASRVWDAIKPSKWLKRRNNSNPVRSTDPGPGTPKPVAPVRPRNPDRRDTTSNTLTNPPLIFPIRQEEDMSRRSSVPDASRTNTSPRTGGGSFSGVSDNFAAALGSTPTENARQYQAFLKGYAQMLVDFAALTRRLGVAKAENWGDQNTVSTMASVATAMTQASSSVENALHTFQRANNGRLEVAEGGGARSGDARFGFDASRNQD